MSTRWCDWCGVPIENAEDHLELVVCSQGCHEFRKLALGKTVGMGPGLPHKFVEPAHPQKWPGYKEKRDAASARARNAGMKSAARTRALQLA
jgi:hypothetical protein